MNSKMILLSGLLLFAFTTNTYADKQWNQITEQNRKLLKPFEKKWDTLSEDKKSTIIKGLNRWKKMSPKERSTAKKRLRQWNSFDDKRKAKITNHFNRFKKLPKAAQTKLRKRYQWFKSLPPKDKRKLRKKWSQQPKRLVPPSNNRPDFDLEDNLQNERGHPKRPNGKDQRQNAPQWPRTTPLENRPVREHIPEQPIRKNPAMMGAPTKPSRPKNRLEPPRSHPRTGLPVQPKNFANPGNATPKAPRILPHRAHPNQKIPANPKQRFLPTRPSTNHRPPMNRITPTPNLRKQHPSNKKRPTPQGSGHFKRKIPPPPRHSSTPRTPRMLNRPPVM